jgi:hypothetical protein
MLSALVTDVEDETDDGMINGMLSALLTDVENETLGGNSNQGDVADCSLDELLEGVEGEIQGHSSEAEMQSESGSDAGAAAAAAAAADSSVNTAAAPDSLAAVMSSSSSSSSSWYSWGSMVNTVSSWFAADTDSSSTTDISLLMMP